RDCEPPKTKLEDRAVLTQTAKRRLTKLPPSTASIGGETEAALLNPGDGVTFDQMFDMMSSGQPSGSAFERVLSNDEDGAADEAEEEADAEAEADAEHNSAANVQETEPVFDIAQKVELQVLVTQFFATPDREYPPAELNALLRLTVVLTRSPEFAAEFMDSGSLANAVRTMRALSPNVTSTISDASTKEKTPLSFVNAIMTVSKDQQRELRQERTLVVHVLRHIIESRPVLRLLMENLIQGWFESPHYSSSDVNTYVRGTLAYALRDPETYKQVTTERCFLPSYNDEMRESWMSLTWRSVNLMDEDEVDKFEALPEDALDEPAGVSDDSKANAPSSDAAADDAAAGNAAEPAQATASSGFLEYLNKKKQEPVFKPYELDAESEKLACRIVEFVADEILLLRPPGTAPPISRAATTMDLQAPTTPNKLRSSSHAMLASAANTPSGPAAASAAASVVPSEETPETIAYRCFLMQSLAELLASFPFALRAIFAARTSGSGLFSPRKDKGKGKAPAPQDDRAAAAAAAQQQSSLRVRSPLISHLVHVLIVREAMTSAKAPKKSKAEEPTEGSELDQAVAIAQHQVAIKRGQLSRSVTYWATALLASMCVRHQEGWSTTAVKESDNTDAGANEITLASLAGNYDKAISAARQLTLDHIVRAFRECLSASASGPGGADLIYARLTSLAHLTNRLVIARAINHGRTTDARPQQVDKQDERESANALKKMVLERGVLDLLTAACSRLNLNHPQSRDMLNVFLRPMEQLSKAAVKISREAVLAAWEESGQDKMPAAAGQRGFNMDLLDDENAQLDEDEDIPPDLYENSALGLHQNQGTGADPYDEDDMMEEDYDDDMYEDDNSSVSDIDTEDEVMDDDIMLDDDDVDAADEDAMEMDTIMHEGDEDDDVSSESGHTDESGDDDGSDVDGESDDDDGDDVDINQFRFALDNILQDAGDRALHEEEERIMHEGDEDDYFSSDLRNFTSSDGDHDSDHEHEDGWHTEQSDAEPNAAEVVTLRRRPVHARVAGRSRPASAGGSRDPLVAAAGADRVSRSSSRAGGEAAIAAGAEDSAGDHLSESEAESDESGEEIDSFVDDFPDSLEITMEAIDGQGHPEGMNSDLSNFILDTLAATISDDHGLGVHNGVRVSGLPGLGHGRPLGVINGMPGANNHGRLNLLRGNERDGIDFSLPRLPGLGRPGLAVGGLGAAGQSMAHAMVDSGDRADRVDRGGMQARAERMARGSLNGPLRATPDDAYELGQSLATRLSSALSSGRRPAYTHRLLAGPSNRTTASPWTQESAAQSSGGLASAVAGAETPAAFEQLVRMCRASAAIECYTPLSTIERWQEEARMLYGGAASEFVPRLSHPVLNALIPEAIVQNLLRIRYRVEVMRRAAIVDRKKMEREDEERRQREEKARLEEEVRLREADAQKEAEDSVKKDSDDDAGMSVDSGEGAEGNAEANADDNADNDEAPEPVFVTVDGERIDITDTGIDIEFLLALPDDLRMEVIENRREELRMERAANERGPESSGNAAQPDHDGFIQEFLDALPQEIRDEVMESGPLQRQLLEQEGLLHPRHGSLLSGALQTETSSSSRTPGPRVSAVEEAVRERVRGGALRGALRGPSRIATGAVDGEEARVREKRRKKIATRDIGVQLLSNAEVAALARFIFLPNHAVSSALMLRIVQCVCENGRTRAHFIHLLLAVLDSGATSLDGVDSVIRQALSADAADAGARTPQRGADSMSAVLGTTGVTLFTAALVQQAGSEFSFPLSDLRSDVAAYMPAQRCLETLHSLAAHNARAAMHFLVEHHALRARGDDSRFPVVHLLRLLTKPLYYSHGSAITELLVQLLATVTKPLGGMVRRSQEQNQEPERAVTLPTIPPNALRAVVNVVAAGECTSRTFQHTLSLIQNLSHMPGVLPIITDELVRRASELSELVCTDIAQLQDVLQVLPPPDADDAEAGAPTPELLDRVRDITLAKFSPASSHQSRLLRLLMAIDYVSTTVAKRLEEKKEQTEAQGKEQATPADGQGEMQDEEPTKPDEIQSEMQGARMDVDALGHDAKFLPLWAAAGRCLQHTGAHAELAHVATVLLPLIESFMVVFKPVVGEKSRSDDGALVSPAAAQAVPTAGEAYFQNFTEKHKKVLNTLVRNNPGLLSGSFSLLVFNPHVLDFDNKRSYFYQRLHDDSSSRRAGATRPLGHMLQVNVRRRTVFEDSYQQFVGKSGDEIRRARINVKFRDEEGVDAGGVSREWFQALARQMFNPDYALFMPSAAGRVTYQPNPQSWANPDHLLYFRFVGRIIGKAIVDQRVLDAYFTRSFYKHILGRKVDYRDMEAIDPSYYKSLEWILENDITDVFEETFSFEVNDFGNHRVIDLVPNGHDVLVTEDNKAEYVRLVTEQRLYRAIKDQINEFLTGFHDVIPKDLIQIFNEQELELLISGMPDIDVDDWRNSTEYHGGYNSSSAQIQWFWRAVRSFDQEERAKLLQFVTGTSKVPLEGFAHLQGNQGVQKFQIHKGFASPTRLPTAHTCFNQLDLPLYDSFDTLKSNLLLAISECSTGFGFV
ncbi:E3 ubiquitin-protein ligase tom1, partial [Coemansia erecta]